MREQAYRPLTQEELAQALGVQPPQQRAFARLLQAMEEDGAIVRTRTGRYGAPERLNLVVGRLEGNPRGYGFVIPDLEGSEDLYIGPHGLNGALHNDRVIARIHGRARNGRRAEGEVIRILERANDQIVGTLQRRKGYALLVPDDPRLAVDVLIPPGSLGGARNGDVVVVKITDWPRERRAAEGKVIQCLGRRGDPGVDIAVIVSRYGLSPDFPAAVRREVSRIPREVQPEDRDGRLDLRDLPVVTIDGEDAKDLDDAVSLERAGDTWRLGVHIADVSHYVREGSALDQEAAERGTSVYLVDRVIPMLPPELSNGICSLNPRVERLTLSVFIDFDRDGRPRGQNIAPSVIRTAERMTYKDVARILEDGDRTLHERYEPLVPVFEDMERLCRLLGARREKRGSIDFDFTDEKVILDERGRPVDVIKYRRTIADRMIEEFMLAANETIAAHFFWLGVPFLYRVHEEPDPDRIADLDEFLGHFGLGIKGIANLKPKALQSVLARVAGRKEEHLINTVVLRSLKKARYAAQALGHFGLAAPYYTHFTSPIRRYPDLVVHRIVKEVVAGGGISPRRQKKLSSILPGIADVSSRRERLAEEAERETVDLKKVQFMADKVGEVYPGIISGVTAFGLFVELENTVEGLVHVSNLTDDYYHYDQKGYALIGERTRRRYRLGDEITVQVARVSAEDRQIDFVLV